MNIKKKMKSFAVVLGSNAISSVITALVLFIVPRYIGVESYGWFQLYQLYGNYILLFRLGWPDGVFLEIGGKDYRELDTKRIRSNFILYSAIEIVFGFLIAVVGVLLPYGSSKKTVFFLLGISAIFMLPRIMLQYILQATDRMREYASLVVIEKVIYGIGIAGCLISGKNNFEQLIIVDICSKIGALVYAVLKCKDLVFGLLYPVKDVLNSAKNFILSGSNLMLAQVASSLIIGVVQMSIEQVWNVEVFGKISLTLTISNFLMVFIRAVALVLFPMLRRAKSNDLAQIYNAMYLCLMIPLAGCLIFYYPAKTILTMWLPQYADSLKYMAILFPICIFESKMSMLVETYLKTIRKEKWLLFVNAGVVILSMILTLVNVFAFRNLDAAVFTIILVLFIRCAVAEHLLSKIVSINTVQNTICEFLVTGLFIVSNYCIGGAIGCTLYFLIYMGYLRFQKEKIYAMFTTIRNKK